MAGSKSKRRSRANGSDSRRSSFSDISEEGSSPTQKAPINLAPVEEVRTHLQILIAKPN